MTPIEGAPATDEQMDVSGLERSLRHPRALFSFG
jgi:hypothetical protein